VGENGKKSKRTPGLALKEKKTGQIKGGKTKRRGGLEKCGGTVLPEPSPFPCGKMTNLKKLAYRRGDPSSRKKKKGTPEKTRFLGEVSGRGSPGRGKGKGLDNWEGLFWGTFPREKAQSGAELSFPSRLPGKGFLKHGTLARNLSERGRKGGDRAGREGSFTGECLQNCREGPSWGKEKKSAHRPKKELGQGGPFRGKREKPESLRKKEDAQGGDSVGGVGRVAGKLPSGRGGSSKRLPKGNASEPGGDALTPVLQTEVSCEGGKTGGRSHPPLQRGDCHRWGCCCCRGGGDTPLARGEECQREGCPGILSGICAEGTKLTREKGGKLF